MSGRNFSEDDKTKTIEFLNYVAKFAKFEMNTEQLINYYKLLHHMQTSVLPKINDHILEVKRVIEAPKSQETSEKVG